MPIETHQAADSTENHPAETGKKKQIRATTTWHHRFQEGQPPRSLVEWLSRFDLGPPELYEPRPDTLDRGPVPYHPVWRENVFVLKFVLPPLAAQWALQTFTNVQIQGPLAFALQFLVYQLFFLTLAISTATRAHRFMVEYGTLNEHKRGRDIVPDVRYKHLHYALIVFVFVRNIGLFYLGKDHALKPTFSVWSPIKIGLFQIALDYFFYTYHRATHEIDALWFVHREHHATKTPTPFLALWADNYQDIIEWILTPLGASLVIKLTFAELYIASGYVVYVEAIGHSGIRAHWLHPYLGKILKPFGMELAVEDHDIHHRHGRGGKNFGKQTRVWDVLFGTCAPREEEAIYAAAKGL